MNVTAADIDGEAAVVEYIKSRNGNKNIIEVLGHGWLKGSFRVYYIDMELAQTTLTDYIAAFRTQITPFEFLNPSLAPVFLNSTCATEDRIQNLWVIGKHVIDGLVFLHSGGHVHRDLKPSNGTNNSTFAINPSFVLSSFEPLETYRLWNNLESHFAATPPYTVFSWNVGLPFSGITGSSQSKFYQQNRYLAIWVRHIRGCNLAASFYR